MGKIITSDGREFSITIFDNGEFSTYETLFDFLYANKDRVFIFTSNTGRPVQREIQNLLVKNINILIKKRGDNEYHLDVVECWNDVAFDKFGLSQGEEVFGITKGLLTGTPINLKSYTS